MHVLCGVSGHWGIGALAGSVWKDLPSRQRTWAQAERDTATLTRLSLNEGSGNRAQLLPGLRGRHAFGRTAGDAKSLGSVPELSTHPNKIEQSQRSWELLALGATCAEDRSRTDTPLPAADFESAASASSATSAEGETQDSQFRGVVTRDLS
jgi:hypothetical protein